MKVLAKISETIGYFSRLRIYILLVVLAFSGVGLATLMRMAESRHQAVISELLSAYADRLAQVALMQGGDFAHLDRASTDRLRPLFRDPIIGSSSYPFVMLPDGRIILHFYRGDSTRLDRSALEAMARTPGRRGSLEYQFARDSKPSRIAFCYRTDLGVYVAVEQGIREEQASWATLRWSVWLIQFLIALSVWLLTSILIRPLRRFSHRLGETLSTLAKGEMPPPLETLPVREWQALASSINAHTEWLQRTIDYSNNVGMGCLDESPEGINPNGALGQALVKLRDKLKEQIEAGAKQQGEESLRNWRNSSLASFNQLLREQSSDIGSLTELLLQKLVVHLGAVQGGFYVVRSKEEGGTPYLALEAVFAYGRKKYIEGKLNFGEGLVGTCALERELTLLKEIPPEYCTITSGLGETPPRELLLLPLVVNDEIYGIIEMASLRSFAEHEVEFARSLSESIASTLMTAQSNERTAALLADSQQQRARARKREEALREALREAQERANEATPIARGIEESFLIAYLDERLRITRTNALAQNFERSHPIGLHEGSELKDLLASLTPFGPAPLDADALRAPLNAGALASNGTYKVLHHEGTSLMILHLTLIPAPSAETGDGFILIGDAPIVQSLPRHA